MRRSFNADTIDGDDNVSYMERKELINYEKTTWLIPATVCVCVCVQVAGNIYMCGIAVNLYVDQNGMLRSGGFVCVWEHV